MKVNTTLLIMTVVFGLTTQGFTQQSQVGGVLSRKVQSHKCDYLQSRDRVVANTKLIEAWGFPVLRAGVLTEAQKFLEYGAAEARCETEMAHLDNYAIALQNKPGMRAYVIAYGGYRGTARHEMRARRARIKRYLINERGIDAKRLTVIDGGFRESLTIELWLIPHDAAVPKPTPTISSENVKYKKEKYSFNCSSFY
jgi:hypothetical protein